MAATKDLVIETKLDPPHTYGSIARDRLQAPDALVQGQYKIALVTAPAGYGKSTLLSQWYLQLKDEGMSCTWLSIEPQEDNATRFMRYLAHSIEREVEGFSHGIISLLDSGSDPESQSFVEHFLTMLNAINERIFIFLDDFHCIENSRLLELFDWSLNHLASNITFIIGSREMLPFPTARLKLQHQLLVLEIKDLRFTEGESRELLKDAPMAGTDDSLVHQLTERTEGWPAALVLASLSLDDVGDTDEFIANITGEDWEITDYLASAVLAGLTDDLSDFMKRISLCDRFTSSLCEEMTENADSKIYLEEIRRRNMFLVALDRRGKWFRFHHLFGSFLSSKLRKEGEGEIPALYRRAANWHFSHGTIDEGVQYALLAGEYDLAAEWIAGHMEELVQQRGKHSTLLSWLDKLPEEVLQRWTDIRIFYAWSLNFMHQYEAAQAQLKKLEDLRIQLASDDQPDEETADSIARATGVIWSIQWALRDRVEESAQQSGQWLENWNDHQGFQVAPVQVVHGFACKCKSDFKGCQESITESYKILESAKSFYILAWAVLIMTLSLAKQGKHNEAIRECNRYKEKIDEELGSNSHSSMMLAALLAAMHYERNEMETCGALLRDCLAYVKEQGSVDSVIAAYTTESRLRFQNQDIEGGFAILEEGETLGLQRDFPRLAVTLLGEKILAHLRLRQVSRAQDLMADYDALSQYSGGKSGYGDLPLAILLRARVLIAGGEQLGDALDLLSSAIHRARNLGLGRRLVELMIVRSIARAKSGQTNEALRDLRDALERAAPQQYLRVFLDEGDAIRQLLIQLIKTGPSHRQGADAQFMRALLDAFNLPSEGAQIQGRMPIKVEPEVSEKSIVDDITPKEVSILQLLSEGKSNKQIAKILFVTEGTIKWHLHNIYTKLNAANRSEAVALARKFTIIF